MRKLRNGVRDGRYWVKAVERIEAIVKRRADALARERDSKGHPFPLAAAKRRAESAKAKFDRFAKEHNLAGDMKKWARKGSNWRSDIRDVVQRYHEHLFEAQALEFRGKFVNAARALLSIYDSPIDPVMKIYALADIKRYIAMDGIEFGEILAPLRQISFSIYGAVEHPPETDIPFVGGSPWGQFVLNMQSFARRNGLPHQVGKTTPGNDDRYGAFAEFLWALEKTLPVHLRSDWKKSTFVREAKEAQKRATDFAAKVERLDAAEDEPATA